MTEQEIINILKENKEKGVANLFLPEEVIDWVSEHLAEPKLLYLSPTGTWRFFFETDLDDYDNVVFALPGDYEPKQESKGEWMEFEIKSGVFDYDDRCFDWWDWGCFLNYCKGYNTDDFTAFGGWQYENDNRWYMAPAIKLKTDNYYWNSYTAEKEEVKPAIPVKIRFWRESR